MVVLVADRSLELEPSQHVRIIKFGPTARSSAARRSETGQGTLPRESLPAVRAVGASCTASRGVPLRETSSDGDARVDGPAAVRTAAHRHVRSRVIVVGAGLQPPQWIDLRRLRCRELQAAAAGFACTTRVLRPALRPAPARCSVLSIRNTLNISSSLDDLVDRSSTHRRILRGV
jgi:hypothetical protein